jgi:hypothetical protein
MSDADPRSGATARGAARISGCSTPPVAVALYALVIGLIVWGSYAGAQNMGYNWQWYRVPQYIYSFTDDGFQWGEILHGLVATIVADLGRRPSRWPLRGTAGGAAAAVGPGRRQGASRSGFWS